MRHTGKRLCDRSLIDRLANAFYEIDFVDGIELMCTEMFVQIAGMVLLVVLADRLCRPLSNYLRA